MKWYTVIFIVMCLFLVMALAYSMLKSYHKGYDFGNSLSDETMKKFKTISDENVKLKERDVVLSDVAIRYFASVRKALIESPEEVIESMEEYDEKAKQEAFGEYGNMFKEEIDEYNNTKGTEEFNAQTNAK